MAEYIERETAKAKIREKFKFVPARIEINEVLNSIPAADVRPVEWIPVTERLPEIKEPVLAMVHWDDYGDTMMCYGCRYKTRWYLWNCVEGELLKDFTVTHWMPLPSTEGLDEA